jgi:FkbM family methyltransferase
MISQDHEKAVAAFLRENVRPGQLCLDVGANVGQYVLQFGHWTAPHGRIIAFEPYPETVRVLERHVRMNGLEDRVWIVNAAVGGIPGFATLHFSGTNTMNRLDSPDPWIPGTVNQTRVQVLTLDDFCETQTLVPDWILIDY